eukprot:CAMPEP_0194160818 /NCGR_PEP_ID=MMETSP0152-20130528/78596_1 /TAXON_ID=1049557 /ORGANISM="Thalassiothrix antarctica, Strain L6-D1" /LENGTH=1020 /DNA_ID=CAMNT_0038870539 /DNA_START=133 /DNA_END=3197 /DNA_ORIENTATION=-
MTTKEPPVLFRNKKNSLRGLSRIMKIVSPLLTEQRNKSSSDISLRRSLAVGDFDEINDEINDIILKDFTLTIPDQTVSVNALFTLTLDLKRMICFNFSIGDIVLNYILEEGGELKMSLKIIGLDLKCALDYNYRYGGFLSGDGEAGAFSDDNSIQLSFSFFSDDFRSNPPNRFELKECRDNNQQEGDLSEVDITISRIQFNGGIVGGILNLFESTIRNALEGDIKDIACSAIVEEVQPLGNEFIDTANGLLEPYLTDISPEYADALYPEKALDDMTLDLLKFGDLENELGSLVGFIIDSVKDFLDIGKESTKQNSTSSTTTNSTYNNNTNTGITDNNDNDDDELKINAVNVMGSLVGFIIDSVKDFLDIGKESTKQNSTTSTNSTDTNNTNTSITENNNNSDDELKINAVIRDNLLDEDRSISINASNLELGNMTDNIIFELNDELTNTTMKLNSIQLYGLDTFTKFEPLTNIGNYTLQGNVQLSFLEIKINLLLEIRPTNGNTDNIVMEEVTVTAGVEDVSATLSAFLAVDQDKLEALSVWQLLEVDRFMPCLLSTIVNAEVSGLNLTVMNFRPPVTDGFISQGIDRIVTDLVDSLFIMYETSIVKALPNFFQTTVRDIINDDVIQSLIVNATVCPNKAKRTNAPTPVPSPFPSVMPSDPLPSVSPTVISSVTPSDPSPSSSPSKVSSLSPSTSTPTTLSPSGTPSLSSSAFPTKIIADSPVQNITTNTDSLTLSPSGMPSLSLSVFPTQIVADSSVQNITNNTDSSTVPLENCDGSNTMTMPLLITFADTCNITCQLDTMQKANIDSINFNQTNLGIIQLNEVTDEQLTALRGENETIVTIECDGTISTTTSIVPLENCDDFMRMPLLITFADFCDNTACQLDTMQKANIDTTNFDHLTSIGIIFLNQVTDVQLTALRSNENKTIAAIECDSDVTLLGNSATIEILPAPPVINTSLPLSGAAAAAAPSVEDSPTSSPPVLPPSSFIWLDFFNITRPPSLAGVENESTSSLRRRRGDSS